MRPNKFTTKSEGSERERERGSGRVGWGAKGGRNPSPLQCHIVSFIFIFSIGKTASGCSIPAWVPEMPGCVDLKESLQERQRHRTDA